MRPSIEVNDGSPCMTHGQRMKDNASPIVTPTTRQDLSSLMLEIAHKVSQDMGGQIEFWMEPTAPVPEYVSDEENNGGSWLWKHMFSSVDGEITSLLDGTELGDDNNPWPDLIPVSYKAF
jgi:hypothetical protein